MSGWSLRLARYAFPFWRGILSISVLMFASAGLEALKPWPLKLLVDYVLPQQPMPANLSWIESLPQASSSAGLCTWLAAATLFVFIAAWLVQTGQAYIQSGVALQITYSLGAKAFEHLQRLSLRYHSRRPAGDLVRRVTRDSRCARDLVLEVLAPAATSVVMLLVMFVTMGQLDLPLTLVALAIIPALVLAQRRYYQPMMERTYDQQHCEGAMMSHAERTLTALPIVQTFRREEHEETIFRQTARETLAHYRRALAAQLKFNIWVGAASAGGRAAVLAFGGYRVLQGQLSVGDLLVFLAYVGMLYTPLDTLTRLASSVAACQASVRRVFDILDTDDLISDSPETHVSTPQGGWQGRLAFHDVSFAYEPDRRVLHHINLEVQPGECIALVGQTGAGKSTLISLLLRFFDPSQGRITLDGVELRDIRLATLRSQIAILLQEPFLLPVSIAENIAYGHPEASQEEIASAASAAHADSFISKLPQGYDTVIGERGATLSGGERQRLAIARALLKDAPILILDEPTSALDARTERLLLDALDRLKQGRTTLVIAHRLSTIRDADRIIVLDEGRIVEVGSHETLTTKGSKYAELLRASTLIGQAVEGSLPWKYRKMLNKFILLTTQRTGSTWLVDMVNSHPLAVVYSELFLQDGRGTPTWGGQKDLVFWETFVSDQVASHHTGNRRDMLVAYLDSVYSERPGVRAVGFKLMYGQSGAFPEILEYAAGRCVRVVHLVRRNMLDVILSRYAADARGTYHARAGETVKEVTVRLDTTTLLKEFETQKEQVRKARRKLSDCGLLHFEVCYEDLVVGPDAFKGLLNFLGLEPTATPLHSSLQRMNPLQHRELLENYSDVAACLRDTSYASFLR